jgi:peptide/nickel transport system substrate-binding protein
MKLAESVEATGPLEVTVTMSAPWATFPVLIAQQPGFVAYPTSLNGEVEEPIGTGPFAYDEWVRDDHFTGVRNENYWRTDADGVQLPYLNEVEFRVIPQGLSRQQSLDAGDIDMMHTNSAAQLLDYGKDLDAGDDFTVTYTSGAEDEQLIALNSQTGAGDDPRLRHAIALATNRAALNDELYDGFFTLADAPYPPDSRWYTDPEWPDYDLDAARAIIDGLKADQVNTSITLSVVTDTEYVQLAQAIAEMWEQAGITVSIESLDAGTLTLNIVTGKYEAALFSLFNAPDPDGDYHFWDPTNITEPGQFSLAFTRFQNDSLKEAMDAARATIDEEARAAEYAKVWHIVATQFPIIWLWHTQFVIVARNSVHGIEDFVLPDGSPAQIVNWGSVFLTQAWTA